MFTGKRPPSQSILASLRCYLAQLENDKYLFMSVMASLRCYLVQLGKDKYLFMSMVPELSYYQTQTLKCYFNYTMHSE